jgi:hypothetical protein
MEDPQPIHASCGDGMRGMSDPGSCEFANKNGTISRTSM